jgi:hypothetical protein
MINLEISDLSFCEVASQEDIEVKGGSASDEQLSASATKSLIRNFFSSRSVNLSSRNLEPISISTGDTFEKISDEASGISGVNFDSKDGNTKVTVLKSPDSSFISASSIQTSNNV